MHNIGEIGESLRRATVEVVSREGAGCGSGVIWPGTPARVITNAHVCSGAGATIRFSNGEQARAETRRVDRRADLAELSVEGPLPVAARIRDSSEVRRGEFVIAIGNPLGFTGAMSTGVVHGIGPVRGLGRRPWIQAQIRMAPGNSGGPLADSQARVIGINSMVVSGGPGLAVPSSAVAAFLNRDRDRARLGVTLRPLGERGMLVLEVDEGSRAQAASLLPGDILVSANGTRLREIDDLGDVLDCGFAELRLGFQRGGGTIRRVVIPLEQIRGEAA